jgi:hypothetical protein
MSGGHVLHPSRNDMLSDLEAYLTYLVTRNYSRLRRPWRIALHMPRFWRDVDKLCWDDLRFPGMCRRIPKAGGSVKLWYEWVMWSMLKVGQGLLSHIFQIQSFWRIVSVLSRRPYFQMRCRQNVWPHLRPLALYLVFEKLNDIKSTVALESSIAVLACLLIKTNKPKMIGLSCVAALCPDDYSNKSTRILSTFCAPKESLLRCGWMPWCVITQRHKYNGAVFHSVPVSYSW